MKISKKILITFLTTFGFLIISQNNEPVLAAGDSNKETFTIGLDDTFAPMGFRD